MLSYEELSPQTGNTLPVKLLVTGELVTKGNDGGDFWPVKGLNRFVWLNFWFLVGSTVWGGGGTVRRQDEARSSGSLVGYCQVQVLTWLLCPQVYKQPHSTTATAVSLPIPLPQLGATVNSALTSLPWWTVPSQTVSLDRVVPVPLRYFVIVMRKEKDANSFSLYSLRNQNDTRAKGESQQAAGHEYLNIWSIKIASCIVWWVHIFIHFHWGFNKD